jgi:hypothetical protein
MGPRDYTADAYMLTKSALKKGHAMGLIDFINDAGELVFGQPRGSAGGDAKEEADAGAELMKGVTRSSGVTRCRRSPESTTAMRRSTR